MTNWDILKWCEDKEFKNPKYLAALLSTFTPDVNELESWDIDDYEGNYGKYYINDVYYNIASQPDIEKMIEYYKNDVERDYYQEVPEELHEYIDWKRFWDDNPITIKMYTQGSIMVNFRGEIYYIIEQ